MDTSTPDRIVDAIKAGVATGAFTPGYKLGQTELATQHGVSRVPVREALRTLAAEGVVEHVRNRGFFIAAPKAKHTRREPGLIDLAAHLGRRCFIYRDFQIEESIAGWDGAHVDQTCPVPPQFCVGPFGTPFEAFAAVDEWHERSEAT